MTEPQYRCPGFRRAAEHYRDVPESLFDGAQRPLGCDAERVLRDEAIRLGMHPEAYFESALLPTLERMFVPESEIDACIPFRVEDDPATESFTFIGEFAEDAIPSSCYDGTMSCDIRFSRREHEGGVVPEIETARAERVGHAAIEAFLPTSRPDCAGPHCTRIWVTPTEERIQVRAETEVPMTLLFGRSVTVHSSDWETREVEIIQQAG